MTAHLHSSTRHLSQLSPCCALAHARGLSLLVTLLWPSRRLPLGDMLRALSLLITVLTILCSCTGHGPTKPPTTLTDHSVPDAQQMWQESQKLLTPGAYAPHVRLPLLFPHETGGEQQLDSINATAHILLFWASWCSDCHEEMPDVLALQREFPQLPWLTVSLDNNAHQARTYVWKQRLAGTHLFDGRDWRGEASAQYAVPLHGIPYMILIDHEGRITWSGGHTDSLRIAIKESPSILHPSARASQPIAHK